MADLSIQFKVDFAKALLELEKTISGEGSVLSRFVDAKETVSSGLALLKGLKNARGGRGGQIGGVLSAFSKPEPEHYARALLLATTGKSYTNRELNSYFEEYVMMRIEKEGLLKSTLIPAENYPWEPTAYIISRVIEGVEYEDIRDVGTYIKSLDEATRFQLIEDGVRVDLIIDGLEEDASEVIDPEQSKRNTPSGSERHESGSLLEERYEGDTKIINEFLRMSAPVPQSTLNPFAEHDPAELLGDESLVPVIEIPDGRVENRARQEYGNQQSIDELVQPTIFRRSVPAPDQTSVSELINPLATNDIVEVLPGVGAAIARRSNMISVYPENRTKNEQLPNTSPVPRPRPKLNPITEGYLKDMPDDGRLILAAEMVGFSGLKEADKAEAERMARFDVQRKMAQDLEDIKIGKVSTVWDRYGHPKAVRDLLGEEAYQSFVDDRLEAGLIAHATAGLHLLQGAELFGIADGTTALEAPHEKLAELMTPKVLAAAAERARDILDMRRTKPSEAVLLSSDLSNRKAQFDAAFDANEAVDAEEMDAFLFYHEAAQREIGIAEPAIEMIPPRWASQVAARFVATPVDNGTPTDRRAREAELKQHYTELQQSFGPRTDDVIAYSLLARTASNGAVQPDDGALGGARAQ